MLTDPVTRAAYDSNQFQSKRYGTQQHGKKWWQHGYLWFIIAFLVFGYIQNVYRIGAKTQAVKERFTVSIPTPTPQNSYYDYEKQSAQDFYRKAHAKGMSDVDIAYYFDISCNSEPKPITDEQRQGVTRISYTGAKYTADFNTEKKIYDELKKGKTQNYNNEFNYAEWQQNCSELRTYYLSLSLDHAPISAAVKEQCQEDSSVIPCTLTIPFKGSATSYTATPAAPSDSGSPNDSNSQLQQQSYDTTNTTQQNNHMYGTDGAYFYRSGNYWYGSNGNSYYQSGNYLYGNNGSSCYQSGSYWYCN